MPNSEKETDMPRTLRRASALIGLFAMSLLLTACAHESETADRSIPGGSAGGESLDAALDMAGGNTACLLGDWELQTDLYTEDAFEWTLSQGVQIDSLQISGSYTLHVLEDGIDIVSMLQTDGVVRGIPVTSHDHYTGSGEWWWEDALDSSITISEWHYDGAGPSSEAGPPVIDPLSGQPIRIACDGDTMLISGPGAPLTGTFFRMAR